MRKYLILSGITIGMALSSLAQNVPLFHQNITDGFLTNPAYIGRSGGSVSFSHRRLWSGLGNTPTVNYLSGHYMMHGRPLGIGANVYTENYSVLSNFRMSTGASYGIDFNSDFQLTFGLLGEVYQSQLDMDKVFVLDYEDPLLSGFNNHTNFDLTSGLVLAHRLFDVGFAYNRMATSWSGSSGTNMPTYLTLTANGRIPVRYGNDLLEPRLVYLSVDNGKDVYSLSTYYTYDNFVMTGLTLRSESVAAFSLAFRFENRYLLGYSMERSFSSSGRDLGYGHEITLRVDFNKQYFRRVNPSEDTPIRNSTYKKRSG